MPLSEDTKERIVKAVDVSKTLLHYGWVPFVLYIGFTRSTPQPSLIKHSSQTIFPSSPSDLDVRSQYRRTSLRGCLFALASPPPLFLPSSIESTMSRLSSHAARTAPKRKLGIRGQSEQSNAQAYAANMFHSTHPARPTSGTSLATTSAFDVTPERSAHRQQTILPQAQVARRAEPTAVDIAGSSRGTPMEAATSGMNIRQFEYVSAPSRPPSNGINATNNSQTWSFRDPSSHCSSVAGSPAPDSAAAAFAVPRSRPNTHNGDTRHRYLPSSTPPEAVPPPRTAPDLMPRPHSSTGIFPRPQTAHDPLETHMRAWLTRVEKSQSEVLAAVDHLSQAQSALASQQTELAKAFWALREAREASNKRISDRLDELQSRMTEQNKELLQQALQEHSADCARRQLDSLRNVSAGIQEIVARNEADSATLGKEVRSLLESVRSSLFKEMATTRAEQRDLAREGQQSLRADLVDLHRLLHDVQSRLDWRHAPNPYSAAPSRPPTLASEATGALRPDSTNARRISSTGDPSQERLGIRQEVVSTQDPGPRHQAPSRAAPPIRPALQQSAAMTDSPTRPDMPWVANARELEAQLADNHRDGLHHAAARSSPSSDEDAERQSRRADLPTRRPAQRYGGAAKRQRRFSEASTRERFEPSSPVASTSDVGIALPSCAQPENAEPAQDPPSPAVSAAPSSSSKSKKKKKKQQRTSGSSSKARSRSPKKKKQQPRSRGPSPSTRKPIGSEDAQEAQEAQEEEADAAAAPPLPPPPPPPPPQHNGAAGTKEALLLQQQHSYRYQTRSRSRSCAHLGISLLTEPLEIGS